VAVTEGLVREEQLLHDMCLLGAVTVEITQILTRARNIWRKYIWTPLKIGPGLVMWWSTRKKKKIFTLWPIVQTAFSFTVLHLFALCICCTQFQKSFALHISRYFFFSFSRKTREAALCTIGLLFLGLLVGAGAFLCLLQKKCALAFFAKC